MQVVKLLHKRCVKELAGIDVRRVNGVWLAVEGLLQCEQLWLTALGRHLNSEALEKHSIKRLDRLLGNESLKVERERWYRWLARTVLGDIEEPVILVDWSPLNARGYMHVLRAAVAVGGRALPIYEQVGRKCNDPVHERRLLRKLRTIVGAKHRPIVVTDAGFGASWFSQVEQMGWRYVGRILGILSVKLGEQGKWMRNSRLHAQANAKPAALGPSLIRQGNPVSTSLFLYARTPKGRVKLTSTGKRSYDSPSHKHEIREAQPWLLASNVEDSPHRIVALYGRRMQIEESFRDLKCPRHGFALRQNIGRDRQRVANLLLLGALGMLATWLTGLHGELKGMARGLQANTTQTRRVLSTFFIGRRLNAKNIRIGPRQLLNALHQLRDDVYAQAFDFAS